MAHMQPDQHDISREHLEEEELDKHTSSQGQLQEERSDRSPTQQQQQEHGRTTEFDKTKEPSVARSGDREPLFVGYGGQESKVAEEKAWTIEQSREVEPPFREYPENREAPSSQVGYGGSDNAGHFNPSHWESSHDGNEEQDSRVSQSRDGEPLFTGYGEHREAPSSQVGYGGSDNIAGNFNPPKWESTDNTTSLSSGPPLDSHGANQDNVNKTSEGHMTGGRKQHDGGRDQSRDSHYGTVDPNARPSDAAYAPAIGCFGRHGSRKLETHGQEEGFPQPTRPEGAVPLSEYEHQGPKHHTSQEPGHGGAPPEDSGSYSEVRNGVRHGVTSSGFPSGVGPTDDAKRHNDNSEQNHHRGTEDRLPSKDDAPHTTQVTWDGSRGTEEGHHEGAPAGEHHAKEGFLTKMKSKLSSHKHHQGDEHHHKEDDHAETTTNPADAHAHAGGEEDVEGKKGFVTKLKDRILPGHH